MLVGTIDSWLLWNLTDGRTFKTDFTNASRTLLFNMKNLCWDEDLLASFNIPKEILPEPCPSSFYFGNISFSSIWNNQQDIDFVKIDDVEKAYNTCVKFNMWMISWSHN